MAHNRMCNHIFNHSSLAGAAAPRAPPFSHCSKEIIEVLDNQKLLAPITVGFIAISSVERTSIVRSSWLTEKKLCDLAPAFLEESGFSLSKIEFFSTRVE